MKSFSDEEIMSLLRQANQMQVEPIYKQFRLGFINTIIKIFNCTEDVASSIYPESFTNFYFNIQNGKLEQPLQSKLITYLVAIGKNVFRNRFYDTYAKRTRLTDEFTPYEEKMVVEDIQSKKESVEMVQNLLQRIGEPCQTILKLFYLRGFSVESIRQELNMISDGAVRKKKFDCILGLRKLMNNE